MAVDKQEGSFEIGINADDELEQKLQEIIADSDNFIKKMGELNNWFMTDGNLWEGEDAVELRRVVTQGCMNESGELIGVASDGKLGVLAKMNKYAEHIKNLRELARSLMEAIGNAQTTIKNNIQSKLDV